MNIFSSFFGNLGKFWESKINSRILRLNILIFLFEIVAIVWFFNRLPPEIPIFFSRPWGSAWLSGTSSIFILPLFAFLAALINYFLAIYYHQKKTILSELLVIFSFIVSLFSAVSLIKIISLVI